VAIVTTFWLTLVLAHLAAVILYAYGYSKYQTSLARHQRRMKGSAAAAVTESRWDGYTPNAVCFFNFLGLFCKICTKISSLIDFLNFFCKNNFKF
jgi:hypothetical protein